MWTISYAVFASTHIDQVCSCVLRCTEDLVSQMKHQNYNGHNILPEYKQYRNVIFMCISYKIIYLQERKRWRGVMVSKPLARSITIEYCDRYLRSAQYIWQGTTSTILLKHHYILTWNIIFIPTTEIYVAKKCKFRKALKWSAKCQTTDFLGNCHDKIK